MTTMVRAPSAQVNAAELKLTRATATGKVSRSVRATKNAEPADPRKTDGRSPGSQWPRSSHSCPLSANAGVAANPSASAMAWRRLTGLPGPRRARRR